MLTRPHRWVLYKTGSTINTHPEWRWRRHAGNGKIIGASTEGYVDPRACALNAEANGAPAKFGPDFPTVRAWYRKLKNGQLKLIRYK